MKKDESNHQKCWGLFWASFGVFFLIANLVPEHLCVIKFWPIFLIVGGLMKAYCGCGCRLLK
jgi:hypothetical protein